LFLITNQQLGILPNLGDTRRLVRLRFGTHGRSFTRKQFGSGYARLEIGTLLVITPPSRPSDFALIPARPESHSPKHPSAENLAPHDDT
jgi:hypothetical protein